MTARDTTAAMAPRKPLLQRAFNSSSALVGSVIVQAVLRFGSNLILTRLLYPEAFGVVLVITSVTYVMALLAETGIPAFLVRTKPALERRYYDTLWTVQVLRGAVLAVALALLAGPIAGWLGKPALELPLRAASVIFFVDGLKSLAPLRERRNRRDWHNSLTEMGTYALQLPIIIGLAAWLESYWALIYGMIIGAALTSASTYIFYGSSWHRPRLDGAVVKELWIFSRFLAASSVMTIVLNQFDKFFIAGNMSLAIAGLYNMAWSLAFVADGLVRSYSHRIFYAELAHSLEGSELSRAAYYRPMRRMRPLLAFACAGGITFGETFFAIAFDDRYLEAGAMFAILSFRPLLALFARPGENAMLAIGRPRTKFVSDVLKLVWLIGTALIGYNLYGVYGLIWATALVDIPAVLYFSVLLRKAGTFSLREEVWTLLFVAVGLGCGEAMTRICEALSMAP